LIWVKLLDEPAVQIERWLPRLPALERVHCDVEIFDPCLKALDRPSSLGVGINRRPWRLDGLRPRLFEKSLRNAARPVLMEEIALKLADALGVG